MGQRTSGLSANCTRWAILVAFVAQALTFYGMVFARSDDGPGLTFTHHEAVRIAAMGLISLTIAIPAHTVSPPLARGSQARLSRSETFARATVDALPVHIAIVDQGGAIVSTNKPWDAFAGQHGVDAGA